MTNNTLRDKLEYALSPLYPSNTQTSLDDAVDRILPIIRVRQEQLRVDKARARTRELNAINLAEYVSRQRDAALTENADLKAQIAAVDAALWKLRTLQVDHRHSDEVGAASPFGVDGRAYYYAGDIVDAIHDFIAAVARTEPTP